MADVEIGTAVIGIIIGAVAVILNRIDKKDLSLILQRLTKVETIQQIYTEQLKDHLAEGLHSPHTPELDRLLDKMKAKTITQEEVCELRDKLKEFMINTGKENPKYMMAGHLLAIVESEIPQWK